jgi:hypothetical protein
MITNLRLPKTRIPICFALALLLTGASTACWAEDSGYQSTLNPPAWQSDQTTSPTGSNLRLDYHVSRMWSLGLAPFAGTGTFHFEGSTQMANDPQRADISYGVRVGSVWELSRDVKLVMELPFRAGRVQDPTAAGEGIDTADKSSSTVEVDAALGLVFTF